MDFDKMLKDRTLFYAAIGIAIVIGNYAILGITNLVFQVTEAPRTIEELLYDPVLQWSLAQLALAISITVIAGIGIIQLRPQIIHGVKYLIRKVSNKS